MKEQFAITEEEKAMLTIAKMICARVMNETNKGDGDPGPIFTEASFAVTALHTFLYYIDEHGKKDFKRLRGEQPIAKIKQFLEDLDRKIDSEDYGLPRTTMMQMVNNLYELFPELNPISTTIG